jgi:hypothetical protein
MLCMIVEPGTANPPDNSVPGMNNPDNTTSVSIPAILPSKITETGPFEEAIVGKENLTPGQEKLSTALRAQIFSSERISQPNQSFDQSSLRMKKIPLNSAINSTASLASDVPSGNLVYVYVSVKPGFSTHIIDPFVYEVPNRDEGFHLAVAWVDVRNLEPLATLEGVSTIREVIPPGVDIGSVTTQGDTILRTADVRSTYGYTGAGMKIGIISDGVNNIALSKATGDLPNDVTVLSDKQQGDEGTAMLEIVHDMVPDAKLYFHDAGNSQLDFNDAIDALVTNGCTVICDDVNWWDESYFEDGPVASHINTLLSGNNLIYVTSAGNAGSALNYQTRHHYQGNYYKYGSTYWNDFSHGTNTTSSLYVNMPNGSSVSVYLQWDDQWGHSANNYDLYLRNYPDGSTITYSNNVQNGAGNPIEIKSYINTGAAKDVSIDVLNVNGLAQSKNLELFILTDGSSSVYTNNLVPADSIYGHHAVLNAITVAAVPASSPTTIEPFSSLGPVTIAYPTPETRQKPDITGVDGVNVTGVGGFGSPFYGTSAAAPHIAAIVAQYWGAHPTASPAQVRSALYASAVDLSASGKDTTFGYGRADALAMANITPVTVSASKIGIYNSGSWYLDMNGNGIWDAGDKNYGYGAPLWTPVVGDWNGSGISKIGCYKDGAWYLDYDGDGSWNASVDKNYGYGAPGWTPVVGDWNGDGKDKIGAYKDGAWYLDYNNDGVYDAGDKNYAFGGAGWTPVIGKWTSDHSSKIGIYKDGVYYLDFNGDGIYDAGDKTIAYGSTGSNAIVGDWNNDGLTEVGTQTGRTWQLDYDGSGTVDTNTKSYTFGAAGWNPVIGDWNGDGKAKIGIYLNGAWYLDSDGSGTWNASIDKNSAFGTTGWIPLAGKWS